MQKVNDRESEFFRIKCLSLLGNGIKINFTGLLRWKTIIVWTNKGGIIKAKKMVTLNKHLMILNPIFRTRMIKFKATEFKEAMRQYTRACSKMASMKVMDS